MLKAMQKIKQTTAEMRLLKAHGERFMSMFDDAQPSASKPPATKAKTHKQPTNVTAGNRRNKLAGASSKTNTRADGGLEGQNPSSVGVSVPVDSKASAVLSKKLRQPHLAATKRARDEIDLIMADAEQAAKRKASSGGVAGNRKAAVTPARPAVPEVMAPSLPPPALTTPTVDMKRERKLFMSSKAGKVHEAPLAVAGVESEDGEDEDLASSLTPEEFSRLKLEVERLGASALDRKEAKKWKAAMLQRLGAQADKAPRTPASIGKGMANKQGVREGRKLEDAIEAGMVQRKGLGKKKRKAAVADRDWGLQELGPGFKHGILRVKKPKTKAAGGGGSNHPIRGMGSVKLGGGGGKGGKGGKGKKSKKASKIPF